jgi:DNA invertase Pin-like site-specific DNA recombinase
MPMRARPAGSEMLAIVEPGDTIIAAKLDRAFRSSLDALETLGELKRRGVALHLIDLGGDVGADGMAKLVFTILAAAAEGESDRIPGAHPRHQARPGAAQLLPRRQPPSRLGPRTRRWPGRGSRWPGGAATDHRAQGA